MAAIETNAEIMTAENCFQILVDSGTLVSVPLNQHDYRQAILEVVESWKSELGALSKGYFLAVSAALSSILSTPSEWRETGRFLLDATKQVYGNGSHQFLCHAIPSLFAAGLIANRADLHEWVSGLVEIIHPMGKGEHLFSRVAERIAGGRINSIAQLRLLTREELLTEA